MRYKAHTHTHTHTIPSFFSSTNTLCREVLTKTGTVYVQAKSGATTGTDDQLQEPPPPSLIQQYYTTCNVKGKVKPPTSQNGSSFSSAHPAQYMQLILMLFSMESMHNIICSCIIQYTSIHSGYVLIFCSKYTLRLRAAYLPHSSLHTHDLSPIHDCSYITSHSIQTTPTAH